VRVAKHNLTLQKFFNKKSLFATNSNPQERSQTGFLSGNPEGG